MEARETLEAAFDRPQILLTHDQAGLAFIADSKDVSARNASFHPESGRSAIARHRLILSNDD